MDRIEYDIFKIQTDGLSGFAGLGEEDIELLTSAEVTKTFNPINNFIELSFFTLSDVRLQTVSNYTNYSILTGDTKNTEVGNSEIAIDVKQDILSYGYGREEVKLLYNFLDYPYSPNTSPQDFYIETVSPDRTEVRLVSVNLGSSNVLETTDRLIEQFNTGVYSPDLSLYFGNSIFLSIVNIDREEFRDTTAVVVKLYTPLPSSVRTKARLNIVERVSDSIAFEVNTNIITEPLKIPTLRGANFYIEVDTQTTEPSQYFNYNELFSFPTTNTFRELNSLFNEKGAELGVDYSDFTNFINFSSAEERLRNFQYKLQILEQYQTQLEMVNNPGFPYSGTGIEGSIGSLTNLVEGVINNFDHFERHLFYESGSTSWPKSNNVKPYENLPYDDAEALQWFNQELQDAILYDAQNQNLLTNTVPAYLKEDTDNRPYELFIHMIAQHFDNLWLYTDAVSKKYDSDNRLNRGVPKDLVEDLLKNFGIKLYTSNRSVQDLFKYFTANSYDFVDTEPNLDPIITGSNNPTSQNDYQKEIYKRIYHNLPLLVKSKGTERGLRALINCFGIPSDTLQIRTFGGQSSQDLPFFGGEQAWTGSIDKVRLSNTGSIVEGDVLSQYTSIINPSNFYTQDLHRIEVGFSPTHNIDRYIVSQSQYLFPNDPINIDQFIGDPREIETSQYRYLQEFAEQIFEGVDTYDLRDFVRLIKFFDNIVFRMVRDFIPARAVADTGIIIKPHLLERSKYKSPIMSWTRPEFSGSIKTGFITGSNAGAYKSVGFGAVSSSKFDGESSTAYRELIQTPTGLQYKSWGEGVSTNFDREQEQPKFDGELSGSIITVSDGELNRDNPFKNLVYKNVKYNMTFYRNVPQNICIIQGINPYIIRPEGSRSRRSAQQSQNWNLSNFFNFSNNLDYNFIVGNTLVPPNEEYGYEFNAPLLEQYNTFQIQAFKPGATPHCTATTTVRPVRCTMTVNSNNIPTGNIVNSITEYNLADWFNRNDNTQSAIYVNGTQVAPLLPGAPTNYTFNQPQGSQVEITLRDVIDPTCSSSVFVTVDACILRAKTFPFPILPVNLGGILETKVTDLFQGTLISTQYKILVQYQNNSGETVLTLPLDLIPSNTPDGAGNIYNGIDNPFTVPTNSSNAIYQRYADSLQALIQNNASNITGWVIQATQPGIVGCTSTSILTTVSVDPPPPPPDRIPINLFFGTIPSQACGTYTSSTVYIDDFYDGYSFEDVVQFGVTIYKFADPTTIDIAPQGYYANSPTGANSYQRWNMNGTWDDENLIECDF